MSAIARSRSMEDFIGFMDRGLSMIPEEVSTGWHYQEPIIKTINISVCRNAIIMKTRLIKGLPEECFDQIREVLDEACDACEFSDTELWDLTSPEFSKKRQVIKEVIATEASVQLTVTAIRIHDD